MSAPIHTIEGIGPVYSSKLHTVGIATVDALIERCGSILGRKEVAALTGLREHQLDRWVRTADMMRLKGVGKEFSQLLEAAGVRSVSTLGMRDPEQLCGRLAEVNEQRKLARRTPALHEVSAWVGKARSLEHRVH
jgi:predicted RecB family nuclease